MGRFSFEEVMVYASFGKRFLAILIDCFIIFAISLILAPVSFLSIIVYFPVFESSRLKGTPGKLLMGTIIINEDGSTLSYKRAFLRQLLRIVTGFTCLLGYLMFFFTDRRQALHDYLIRSVVIEAEIPSDNYFYAWWDKVKELFSSDSSENRVS